MFPSDPSTNPVQPMAPRAPMPIHHHHPANANANANANATATTNSSDAILPGAQSVQVITLQIPNPEWAQGYSTNEGHRITNSSLGYNFLTNFDIRTLSTTGAQSGNDVTGLLYVPNLDSDDPCLNASAPYIPQNATRRSNLPATDYDLIALAPWLNSTCSLSFMTSARQYPTRGFLFYIPDSGTNAPPEPGDPMWDTGDGGKWKQENGWPVYALPGQDGAWLMGNSSLYSGNMTDVPHGHALTEIFGDSRDYVRLFVDIDTGSGSSSLPSLWVFLLVVLGILLAIIGLTSLSMHWLQRRRRQALRRRVASGEVDLEALGIKRLTVPQELLDCMPLYTYGTGQPVSKAATDATKSEVPTIDEKLEEDAAKPDATPCRPTPTLLRSHSYHPTPLSQPTCAICLDDFVPATAEGEGTTVRELPCHHIFHPECVDVFLRDSSSLCPMCKKAALPKGYCPKVITNAMVRRERMVRQIRERVAVDPDTAEVSDLGGRNRPMSLGGRFRMRTMSGFSQLRSSRRISSAPLRSSQQMSQLGPDSAPAGSTVTPLGRSNSTASSSIQAARTQPAVQPPSTPGRREWARQRAVDMLGDRAPVEPPEEDEMRRSPAWRKAVRGLFPGFRR
ncbi:RING finger membrane [Lecanosticta acicola]|uniref:RING finger membrane n=1 Tax=Lecanosticta acicola TaxID=111012 RepID=A0AAI9E9G7_9PEZI|nr:RING finger membrane [Lecanosticta acicola]